MAAVDKLTIAVNCSGPGNFPLISRTKFSIPLITAANFTSTSGLVATLATAYNNMTSGITTGTETSIKANAASGVPSSTANRGQKWIISASNAVGTKYTYTIPGAPGAGELQSDNISADLAGTNWASFKAAFEAIAVDPFGGALTLDAAKLGGRRV